MILMFCIKIKGPNDVEEQVQVTEQPLDNENANTPTVKEVEI